MRKRLKEISNNPPGIDKRTLSSCPNSSKIVPAIKMVYPTNPHIENNRGTSFEMYNR